MRVWPCKICGKVFQSYQNLNLHRRAHSVFQPYICQRKACSRSFSTLSRYQAHSRFHDNKRRYQCKLCGKGFIHRTHQRHHRCCNTKTREYRCHICQQTFKEILSVSHHFCRNHSKTYIKKSSYNNKSAALQKASNRDVNSEKNDNKILLKITAGKSMTIISPSKNSSHEKKKKSRNKKCKKKPKEPCARNGIILSIKKGTISMSRETKSKAPKHEALSEVNGLVNRVVESFDKGSNLKMKIKTFSERTENEAKSQYSQQSSLNNSKRSKKMPLKLSSDTESKGSPIPNDHVCQDSRIRNGIVIVKDKSGKFLAEQLQSTKAKKRDNVFDSFSDVGMWKVLPSPRHDSPLDGLKLRFSPQKPLRIDTGLDLPFDKAKYLDVAISMKSQKTENYSEDSDVFETSPGNDKDSETGLQNVNDSGIEILSSSSCNRSNGNSVRSVILDENSPTYFPIEDSLLSLDSPITEVHPKAEHTVCTKCGGIVSEANNNAQSPRKCGCNSSMINSPTQVNPSMKLNTPKLSQDSYPAPPVYNNFVETEKKKGDNDPVTRTEKNGDCSEIEESDILTKCDKINKSETLSEFDDVEIIRDSSYTSNRPKNDLKLRLKLKTRKTSTALNKETVNVDNVKSDSTLYSEKEEFVCEQQTVKSETEHENVKNDTVPKKNGLSGEKNTTDLNFEISPLLTKDYDNASENPHKPSDDPIISEHKANVDTEIYNSRIKKKPLFKVKQKSLVNESVKDNLTNNGSDSMDTNNIEGNHKTKQTDYVRKKKPIFKRKSMSSDAVSETVIDKTSDMKSDQKSSACAKESFRQIDHLRDDKGPHLEAVRKLDITLLTETEMQSFESNNKLYGGQNTVSCIPDPLVSCNGPRNDPFGPVVDDSLLQLLQLEDKAQNTSPADRKAPYRSPTQHKAQNTSPTEHKAPDTSPTQHKAQNTSPTEHKAPDTSPTEHITQNTSPTEHKAPDTSPTQHKTQNTSPTEHKAPNTNSTIKKSPCTSPLDLFQQQFLSFLSSNKPHAKEDKAKDCQTGKTGVGLNTELDEQSLPEVNSGESSTTKGTVDLLAPKECNSLKKTSLIRHKSVADRKEKAPKERLSLRKNKTLKAKEDNKSEDSLIDNNKMQAAEKDCEQSEKHNQANDQISHNKLFKSVSYEESKTIDLTCEDRTEQKGDTLKNDWLSTTDTTSISPPKLEPRTDSLSWLKIFSENQDFKSATNKDDKSLNEESPDFSADLAAINKKMDVSDDELNALDVDDVFKSTNLSSLQPISVVTPSMKRRKAQSKCPRSVNRSVSSLKRPRVIVDSGSELSDCSSNSGTIDLDTNRDFGSNLEHDSDGDFHMESFKHSKKNRKLSKQICSVNDDFNSDSDSEFTRLKNQPRQELGVPFRRKRLKQGRKSCCSCCLGSSRKISKEYHHHHKYKLPKNSKQFVKSSLKLLELQAKIHQLFLSLFPECAEIISNSKIGTEEFEMLIDEVLDSLEGKEISFEAAAIGPSDDCNEASHVHTPCSVHSMCGPDLLQAHRVYQTENYTSGMDHWAGNHSRFHSESPETHRVHVYHNHSAGIKQCFESNRESELTTQICDKESSRSFLESATENQETFPQVPTQHIHPVLSTNSQWQDFESLSYDDATELSAFDALESDITITIDLNAAKVSLCRDPKHCLERLNNRISRLVQCLLPKLKLRKSFFRNINNLHFLLDLMITSNLPGSNNDIVSSEDECEIKQKNSSLVQSDKLLSSAGIHLNDFDSYAILNSKSTVLSVENASKAVSGNTNNDHVSHAVPGERIPLLSKFQDIFEQEIKSHRESLKKDVFDLDTCSEKRDQSSLFKAKEVLTTISKIEKMNKARQKLRPRRDPRLRKRSEAESRKLFVQEKIQNNQNSTIVCHSSPKKSTTTVQKLRRRRKLSQSSKESFLSKLDLGGSSYQATEPDGIVTVSQEAAVDSIDTGNTKVTGSTSPVETSVRITEDVKHVDKGPTEEIKHVDNGIKSLIDKTENVPDDKENADENVRNLTVVAEDVKNVGESARNLTEGTKNIPEDMKYDDDKSVRNLTEESKNVTEDNECGTENYSDLKTTQSDQDKCEASTDKAEESSNVEEDVDTRQKSGEKNIFELLQPS